MPPITTPRAVPSPRAAPTPPRRVATGRALPVRFAVRTASAYGLALENRRRRRNGEAKVLAAPSEIRQMRRLRGEWGSDEQCDAWVWHPDERVPIAALRLGVLDHDAERSLLIRAARDAARERVCWTPLLDALPSFRLCSSLRGWYERLERGLARLAVALRATEGSVSGQPAAVDALLRFRSDHISKVVAQHAPALGAAHVRRLARRGFGFVLVDRAQRSGARERLACLEWAVRELEEVADGDPGDQDLDVESGRFANLWCVFTECLERGHRLPAPLAARVERAADQLLWQTQSYSRSTLEELVKQALVHAPVDAMRAMGTKDRETLLRSGCAEIRLAAMAAIGRARGGAPVERRQRRAA